MIDSIYELLAAIGYAHPLHPMIVHVPAGMTVGAFLFILAALFLHRPVFAQSAYHCIVLALIFFFPTVLFGFMDWQYYFSGAWLEPIKIKVALSCVLLIFLMFATFFGRRGNFTSKNFLAMYLLSFLSVAVIGYYGGELSFGNKVSVAPPEYQAGEKIFMKNCSACHPYGGNVAKANLTVIGAPELINYRIFLDYLRDPKQPKGSIALMPIVPPTKISDGQAKQLFDYITRVLERPRRPLDPSLYPMPSS